MTALGPKVHVNNVVTEQRCSCTMTSHFEKYTTVKSRYSRVISGKENLTSGTNLTLLQIVRTLYIIRALVVVRSKVVQFYSFPMTVLFNLFMLQRTDLLHYRKICYQIRLT